MGIEDIIEKHSQACDILVSYKGSMKLVGVCTHP